MAIVEWKKSAGGKKRGKEEIQEACSRVGERGAKGEREKAAG